MSGDLKRPEGLVELDVDGVFNNGTPLAYRQIYGLTIEHVDLDIPDELIDRHLDEKWGSPSSDILSEILSNHSDLYPKARRFYEDNVYDVFDEYTSPVEGAAETIERISARYVLALNTAADKETLSRTLKNCGINPGIFKGGIYTAESLRSGYAPKPHPDISNLIMRFTQTPPEKTWVVGDSACDVHTALYSEVEPIVTLTGNLDRKSALELGARIIVDNVTQIEPVLEMGQWVRRSQKELRKLGSIGIKLIQSPAPA